MTDRGSERTGSLVTMDWPPQSKEERNQHESLFYSQGPVDGVLSGERIRDLFLHSGLPLAVLSRLWNLADATNDNLLDVNEFCLLMYLTLCHIHERKLPVELPDCLYPSHLSTIDLPVISNQEKEVYLEAFTTHLDHEDQHITAEGAKKMFHGAGVSSGVLGRLFNLADLNKDGLLGATEWMVFCHLVKFFKQGNSIEGSINVYSSIPDHISPHSLQAQKHRVSCYHRDKAKLSAWKESRKEDCVREIKRHEIQLNKIKLIEKLYDILKATCPENIDEETFISKLRQEKDNLGKQEKVVIRLRREHERVRQETVKAILDEQRLEEDQKNLRLETEEINRRLSTPHRKSTKDPDPFHQLHEERKELRKKGVRFSNPDIPKVHIPFIFNPFDRDRLDKVPVETEAERVFNDCDNDTHDEVLLKASHDFWSKVISFSPVESQPSARPTSSRATPLSSPATPTSSQSTPPSSPVTHTSSQATPTSSPATPTSYQATPPSSPATPIIPGKMTSRRWTFTDLDTIKEEDAIFKTVPVSLKDEFWFSSYLSLDGSTDQHMIDLHRKILDLKSEVEKLNQHGGQLVFEVSEDFGGDSGYEIVLENGETTIEARYRLDPDVIDETISRAPDTERENPPKNPEDYKTKLIPKESGGHTDRARYYREKLLDNGARRHTSPAGIVKPEEDSPAKKAAREYRLKRRSLNLEQQKVLGESVAGSTIKGGSVETLLSSPRPSPRSSPRASPRTTRILSWRVGRPPSIGDSSTTQRTTQQKIDFNEKTVIKSSLESRPVDSIGLKGIDSQQKPTHPYSPTIIELPPKPSIDSPLAPNSDFFLLQSPLAEDISESETSSGISILCDYSSGLSQPISPVSYASSIEPDKTDSFDEQSVFIEEAIPEIEPVASELDAADADLGYSTLKESLDRKKEKENPEAKDKIIVPSVEINHPEVESENLIQITDKRETLEKHRCDSDIDSGNNSGSETPPPLPVSAPPPSLETQSTQSHIPPSTPKKTPPLLETSQQNPSLTPKPQPFQLETHLLSPETTPSRAKTSSDTPFPPPQTQPPSSQTTPRLLKTPPLQLETPLPPKTAPPLLANLPPPRTPLPETPPTQTLQSETLLTKIPFPSETRPPAETPPSPPRTLSPSPETVSPPETTPPSSETTHPPKTPPCSPKNPPLASKTIPHSLLGDQDYTNLPLSDPETKELISWECDSPAKCDSPGHCDTDCPAISVELKGTDNQLVLTIDSSIRCHSTVNSNTFVDQSFNISTDNNTETEINCGTVLKTETDFDTETVKESDLYETERSIKEKKAASSDCNTSKHENCPKNCDELIFSTAEKFDLCKSSKDSNSGKTEDSVINPCDFIGEHSTENRETPAKPKIISADNKNNSAYIKQEESPSHIPSKENSKPDIEDSLSVNMSAKIISSTEGEGVIIAEHKSRHYTLPDDFVEVETTVEKDPRSIPIWDFSLKTDKHNNKQSDNIRMKETVVQEKEIKEEIIVVKKVHSAESKPTVDDLLFNLENKGITESGLNVENSFSDDSDISDEEDNGEASQSFQLNETDTSLMLPETVQDSSDAIVLISFESQDPVPGILSSNPELHVTKITTEDIQAVRSEKNFAEAISPEKIKGQESLEKARDFAEKVSPKYVLKKQGGSQELSSEDLQVMLQEREDVISQVTVHKKKADWSDWVHDVSKSTGEVEAESIDRDATVYEWENKIAEETTDPLSARKASLDGDQFSGKINLYSENIISEDNTTEEVDREPIADIASTKRHWESIFLEKNSQREEEVKPKGTVRHWEVKIHRYEKQSTNVENNNMADTEFNENESAIEREIRLALEREEMLKREKAALAPNTPNGHSISNNNNNNNELIITTENSAPVRTAYEEMTEVDRAAEMLRRRVMADLEPLNPVMESEPLVDEERRYSMDSSQGSNSDDRGGVFINESIVEREIRQATEREEENRREREHFRATSRSSVSERPDLPVATSADDMSDGVDRIRGRISPNMTYEAAVSKPEHVGESLIARELRETREREEELRTLRQHVYANNTASPASTQDHNIVKVITNNVQAEKNGHVSVNDQSRTSSWQKDVSPFKNRHERKSSVDSLSSSQSSTRGSDNTSSRDKVKVQPHLSASTEDNIKSYEPLSETPIEREIRLAREREDDFRLAKGLPVVERKLELPKAVETTTTTNAVRPVHLPSDNSSTLKRLTNNRLKKEIRKEMDREETLRKEGKISTTSDERVGQPMKFVEVRDETDGTPKRNFLIKKREVLSPKVENSDQNGSGSPVTPVTPSSHTPKRNSLGGSATFSYKETRQKAESRIERELREMREREAELKEQRANATTTAPVVSAGPVESSR